MRKLSVSLALALVLAQSSVSAQPKKVPATAPTKVDAGTAEAKRLFDEGRDAYAAGDYEKAVSAWERSYEISKQALIFDSIANAYERLGKAKQARVALQKWRDAAPASEQGQLDEHLKNLDARIAKEDAEAAAKKAEEDRKDREALAKAQGNGPREVPSLGQQVAPPLLGVGIALAATGVVMDVVAGVLRPNAGDVCKTSASGLKLCLDTSQSAIGTSNTLALVGDVMWIAGLAASGVSTYLFLTSKPKKPSEEHARVTPVVTPRGGGLSVGLRF